MGIKGLSRKVDEAQTDEGISHYGVEGRAGRLRVAGQRGGVTDLDFLIYTGNPNS